MDKQNHMRVTETNTEKSIRGPNTTIAVLFALTQICMCCNTFCLQKSVRTNVNPPLMWSLLQVSMLCYVRLAYQIFLLLKNFSSSVVRKLKFFLIGYISFPSISKSVEYFFYFSINCKVSIFYKIFFIKIYFI